MSKPLKVSLFVELKQTEPKCVQSLICRLRDPGHHVILFACTNGGKVHLLFEEPSPLKTSQQTDQDFLQNSVLTSDACLLITDQPVYKVPCQLQGVTQHFNGHIYSWVSCGVTCALLGGLVHNRKVAMQMRWLLEDSQDLLLGRVLPRPCSFARLYHVDPAWETAEPCVL